MRVPCAGLDISGRGALTVQGVARDRIGRTRRWRSPLVPADRERPEMLGHAAPQCEAEMVRTRRAERVDHGRDAPKAAGCKLTRRRAMRAGMRFGRTGELLSAAM